jgi:hypothetical protein
MLRRKKNKTIKKSMREMEERGLNTDMNWNESSKIG